MNTFSGDIEGERQEHDITPGVPQGRHQQSVRGISDFGHDVHLNDSECSHAGRSHHSGNKEAGAVAQHQYSDVRDNLRSLAPFCVLLAVESTSKFDVNLFLFVWHFQTFTMKQVIIFDCSVRRRGAEASDDESQYSQPSLRSDTVPISSIYVPADILPAV